MKLGYEDTDKKIEIEIYGLVFEIKNVDKLKEYENVEDNDLNREIAAEILRAEDCIVEEAENGYIAVEKVANSKKGYYKLILMDIQMPVMNGYEAVTKIRALENKDLANIPIIAMTANAFREDVQKSLQAGMNAHLSKPVDTVALVLTLGRWITEGK